MIALRKFRSFRTGVVLLGGGAVAFLGGQNGPEPSTLTETRREEKAEKANIVGQMLAFAGRINALDFSEEERDAVVRGLLDCLTTGETPAEIRDNFDNTYRRMQARFNEKVNQTGEPEPFTEETAYTIGHMAGQFSELAGYPFSDAELDALREGFLANLGKEEPSGELLNSWNSISSYLEQKELAYVAAEKERSAARQAAFFEELEEDEDIQSDPSGLHWEVIEEGEGEPPTPRDKVTVHYKGTLIDGTVFDSSYERGQPATFSMSGVIPGFSRGLTKIAPGGKVIIYIPSDLGYGASPPPTSPIGPGDTLIFECELISVDRAEPPPAAPAPGESNISG